MFPWKISLLCLGCQRERSTFLESCYFLVSKRYSAPLNSVYQLLFSSEILAKFINPVFNLQGCVEWEVNGTETKRNVPDSLKSAPLRFGDWTNQLSTEELQLSPTPAEMSFQGQTYCWKPLKRTLWAAREKSDAFSFFKLAAVMGWFCLMVGQQHPDWLEMPRLRSQVQLYSRKKASSKCFSHLPTQALFSHRPALQTPTRIIICEPGTTHFKEKKSEICQWAAKDPK